MLYFLPYNIPILYTWGTSGTGVIHSQTTQMCGGRDEDDHDDDIVGFIVVVQSIYLSVLLFAL